MAFDRDSFLAGIAVGRQLKGWATDTAAGSAAAGVTAGVRVAATAGGTAAGTETDAARPERSEEGTK